MLVKVLDTNLANMIAAGEVVERPSSVAKELCENSIDAGATSVTVEISGGGLRKLSVTDNGCGLHPDDMETAFLRHATSKISSPKDLDSIMTLGFRGEALASIAAVAKVTMFSKMEGGSFGKRVIMEGGHLIESGPAGCPVGTSLVVENLFFNTPARMKFLKKDYTEAGYVEEVVRKLALAHPEISFRFVSDGKEKVFTPGDGSLKSAAYAIYGKDVSGQLVPLEYSEGGIKITGLAGNMTLYRKNRGLQSLYVNNRCTVNRTMTAALEEGYKSMIPIGCFPVAIIKLDINPTLVDVNVHPAKLEVKFFEENKIYSAVYWAVKNAVCVKVMPKIDASPGSDKPIISNSYSPGKPNFAASINSVREEPHGDTSKYEYKPTAAQQREVVFQQKPHVFENCESFDSKFEKEKPAGASNKENDITDKVFEETPAGADKKIDNIEFVQTAVFDTSESYKIIGQLFNTYILVEEGGNLVLIDQHAAHERLIYERLVREKAEKKIMPQMLLMPEIISLTPTEFTAAMENKPFFEEIGYEIEEFGDNDIAVRGIPYVITKEQIRDSVVEIIDNLRASKHGTETSRGERILYTIACKAAVKGHDKLTMAEMEALVKQVRESEKTITCPHGRPVRTAVTKTFIEKLFKRL
ncbi:MAG: DNA mismatch repair endonuclease MutL [Bacillota bacterium]|nr:DNA mismatch repair endonuclease MutL [Bacillota bacterium]